MKTVIITQIQFRSCFFFFFFENSVPPSQWSPHRIQQHDNKKLLLPKITLFANGIKIPLTPVR